MTHAISAQTVLDLVLAAAERALRYDDGQLSHHYEDEAVFGTEAASILRAAGLLPERVQA